MLHSWPSVSTGAASADSTNGGSNTWGKKYYVVADVYYVPRSMMIASVLNMYILFILVIIP